MINRPFCLGRNQNSRTLNFLRVLLSVLSMRSTRSLARRLWLRLRLCCFCLGCFPHRTPPPSLHSEFRLSRSCKTAARDLPRAFVPTSPPYRCGATYTAPPWARKQSPASPMTLPRKTLNVDTLQHNTMLESDTLWGQRNRKYNPENALQRTDLQMMPSTTKKNYS